MKKLFTLLTLLVAIVTGAQAQTSYYTPTADEVIILNDIKTSSAPFSSHAAVAWGASPSSSSKKAGDPSKDDGSALANNVPCYSAKGNGGAKNITVSVTGVSKIIFYHEKQSSRYLELRNGSKSGTLIASGSTNTFVSEFDLTSTTNYNLFLHGTGSGSDDQDLYIYAIKLIADGGSSGSQTLLTGSWSEDAVTVGVGSTATIPTFSVSPTTATAGTDYSVTYSLVSGSNVTVSSTAGITAINTATAGTSVVKATISVLDEDNYKVTQAEYTTTISVLDQANYESYDWDSANAMNEGLAGNSEVAISVATSGSDGNVGGHYYKPLNSAIDGAGGTYLQVSSAQQIERIAVLYCPNGTNQTNLAWAAWGQDVEPSSELASNSYFGVTEGTKSSKSWDSAIWENIDLAGIDAYTVRISRQLKNLTINGSTISSTGANQTINILGIKVWLKAGAPKINTQPQSATYVTGQTIAALTVDATASAGDLSYQWYSCDDANKTNAAEISGATTASYTPTAAGFYYVTVTDDNGSVESDVAQITISAAEAPTISVSGAPAEAVKVGTEVILTATATGTPTPTVAWYDNADTTEPVATGATFTVPTTNAGTYVYYAVASNGVGTDATSDLQTIIVKEQVAKPTISPATAMFTDGSTEVTIECTTTGATIQYSTDGGTTWADYSSALTINATTTLIAKAVKDGCLDSETATGSYTKIDYTMTPLVPVSTATTWDWSGMSTTVQLKEDGTTIPPKGHTFDVNAADFDGTILPENAQWPTTFAASSLAFTQSEYPVRGTYYQGYTVKFQAAVPGIVKVYYSNTSTKEVARYANINGTNYGAGSKNSTLIWTEEVPVEAGMVTITGMEGESTPNYIHIQKIVFTPTVPVTITSAGAASFSSTQALDFSNIEGITAYKATMKTDNYVHLDEVETVPAEAGIIVKGAEGTYDVPVATGDVAELSDNLLVGTATATYTVTQDDYDNDLVYKYVKSNTTGQVGFQKAKVDNVIAVGRAYLKLTQEQASRLAGFADEEGIVTGISSIENAGVDATAPAYNLAGQKVSKSYKGIVIQNGKKVVK